MLVIRRGLCASHAAMAVESAVRGTSAEEAKRDFGLQLFLVWTLLQRLLAPLRAAFQQRRSEELWGREFCPCCGAPPAMAQLVTSTGIRERWLACGRCETRWKYKRIGCPFCGNEDPDLLEILAIEDEQNFRIDCCRGCKGYLKTYTGAGQEELMLADWSTLHFDAQRPRARTQRWVALPTLSRMQVQAPARPG